MSKANLSRIRAASAAAASATAARPAFCRHMPRVAVAALPTSSASSAFGCNASTNSRIAPSSRSFHSSSSFSSSYISATARTRPRIPSSSSATTANGWTLAGRGRRTIFIQTENTPNPDALKFLPNHQVLPPEVTAPFVEYISPRATIAPPYPSPLAAQLMNVDGVKSVFYGSDFITVTKSADANWAHIRPEVFAYITEAITSGQQIVKVAETSAEGSVGDDAHAEEDTLQYDENDSEVVGMIKELLETRIRPAIQEDGGDIEFRGFEDGQVKLKLRGACRTCDSSTVTLKNGIESMLMHYIEEVQGVEQVLDQEEEVALREFAKFEEKLKQQKGAVPPSTVGKGTLDTVAG